MSSPEIARTISGMHKRFTSVFGRSARRHTLEEMLYCPDYRVEERGDIRRQS